jgi:alpha-tubulin suppressor-like RCC1 family protein
MRKMIFIATSCLLLMGLTLSGCTTEPTEGDHLVALTVSSTIGGSVTAPGQGTFSYDAGTVVNLVAQAEAGYRFVKWTGDVGTIADVNAASTTVTMNGDYSIEADFAAIPPVQYSLATSSTRGGSITRPGEGTFAYNAGTVVDLVAKADEGYEFVTWTGDVSTIKNVDAAQTTITMNGSYSIGASFERKYIPMVTGGAWHTVGLRSDGTVVAVGYNSYGQCNVGNWTDIIQVDGGGEHTVGVKSDGTVVAVGYNSYGQCDVGDWTDIIQVVAGREHTVGLRSDGTVVAVGLNAYGQCNVGNWTDIIQVAAGANSWHTVGLKSDGTVVAVGGGWDGECDVEDWTGIIQVAAGGHHTVGLKSDGTVVALGRNNYGECNVGGWTGIVQIAAGCQLTIGLKSDGTVITAGWNGYGQRAVGDWSGVIQVAAGMIHTIGLRSDGSVVAAGDNGSGQCNVGDWMLT